MSPHVDARTPGLLPDPGTGSLATGGCGRRGRGKKGRGVDRAGEGGHSRTSPRGRRRAATAPVSRGLRALRGTGMGTGSLRVSGTSQARATIRLRPPRATRLGPASSHLAGLATTGPLKETQASRDVAAPGLRQPGRWGREARIVTQSDLDPRSMRGHSDSPHPLRCSCHQSRALFPAGNNLRNQLNRPGMRARRLQGLSTTLARINWSMERKMEGGEMSGVPGQDVSL